MMLRGASTSALARPRAAVPARHCNDTMMLRGTSTSALARARATVPVRHCKPARTATRVNASSSPDPGSSGDGKPTKVAQVLAELKKGGWDKDRAKAALDRWSKLGVQQDPEQLRKLLVKSSLKPLGVVGIQLLLDVGACLGGFFTAFSVMQGPSFTGDIILEYIGYAIGCYYFLQVLVEAFALGTIITAVYRFNANPQAYLAAVEELAGPRRGISVVDKVQEAVNIAKVFQTLSEMAELLKEMSEADPPAATTLNNLSAYLTLMRAEQMYGFNPAEYDLTEKEAGNIALVFSEFDLNDDGKLELSEVRQLCEKLGKELNEGELKEAIKVLDTNKNGYIEFNEFVAWWTSTNKTSPSEPQAVSS